MKGCCLFLPCARSLTGCFVIFGTSLLVEKMMVNLGMKEALGYFPLKNPFGTSPGEGEQIVLEDSLQSDITW